MESQGPTPPAGNRLRAAVVILAGGMGSRIGSDMNKVYLTIRGRHILDYSVETVLSCELVTDLVLVHRADDAGQIERLVAAVGGRSTDLAVHTTLGGETRHESEYAGVAALRSRIDEGLLDVVAVHDGARPFMGRDLLVRSLVDAAAHGAVIPGLVVTDELYAMDRHRFVDPHDHVWVQTPQTFDAATLLAAHDAAHSAGFRGVDTAEVVQNFSDADVRIIPGHDANIKITYQTDLVTSEALAVAWESEHADPGVDAPPPAGA
ncbi:MAG: 2-C-methyl-D-erythritol 4-phosphate cytidylyltransferase [Acidimicrobiia bacterium]|nr:2-C-methyl-D-erythritol 4-phosphate cytidylyltransferase [Acidimicrobiia bacterium]